MVTLYGESFVPMTLPNGAVWAALITSLIFPIAMYVLRSIGLYVLAKRKGIKCAFMAFIPCVWIYVVCRLVAETRFLNTTIGKLAVVFTIIFSLSEILTLVYQFFIYFPLAGNFLLGREIFICTDIEFAKNNGLTEYWVGDQGIWINESFVYPYADIYGTIRALNVIYYVSMIFDLLYVIIEITVLMALFRKYWPQHYVLAFIMSVFFGLSGIFIFVIRKKQPVNYADYLRARYRAYGPYGYYGPYGNPYGNPNNYQANQAQPKGPFEEYVDKSERTPEEPFSEYNNDKKDKSDGE